MKYLLLLFMTINAVNCQKAGSASSGSSDDGTVTWTNLAMCVLVLAIFQIKSLDLLFGRLGCRLGETILTNPDLDRGDKRTPIWPE